MCIVGLKIKFHRSCKFCDSISFDNLRDLHRIRYFLSYNVSVMVASAWPVVIWIIATLCFVVCLPRILKDSACGTLCLWCFQIFSCHSNLIVSSLASCCSKYLTTGKPKYFAPYLSLHTSGIKTRHINPERIFLKVSFHSSSVHKSKVHFNKCFSYDAPKSGMICH